MPRSERHPSVRAGEASAQTNAQPTRTAIVPARTRAKPLGFQHAILALTPYQQRHRMWQLQVLIISVVMSRSMSVPPSPSASFGTQPSPPHGGWAVAELLNIWSG